MLSILEKIKDMIKKNENEKAIKYIDEILNENKRADDYIDELLKELK